MTKIETIIELAKENIRSLNAQLMIIDRFALGITTNDEHIFYHENKLELLKLLKQNKDLLREYELKKELEDEKKKSI